MTPRPGIEPGHIGGRRELSPLRDPCSHNNNNNLVYPHLTFTYLESFDEYMQHLIFVRSKRCWKQLGEGTLHRGSRVGRFCTWCCSQRGWKLRVSSRISTHTLLRWRNRFWYGNASYFENQRRIPRQNHEHIQRRTIAKSIGHRCGALQRYTVSPSAGWEQGWNILHRQRSSVRYLLQNSETHHTNLWRLKPPCVSYNERCHDLPKISWPGNIIFMFWGKPNWVPF